jgi:hypothetical protein
VQGRHVALESALLVRFVPLAEPRPEGAVHDLLPAAGERDQERVQLRAVEAAEAVVEARQRDGLERELDRVAHHVDGPLAALPVVQQLVQTSSLVSK